MSSRRATFEVQVLVAKNWTVKNLYDEEEAATQAAEQELKSGRIDGVRILRLWKRADGEHAEKLVFEKIGAASKRRSRMSRRCGSRCSKRPGSADPLAPLAAAAALARWVAARFPAKAAQPVCAHLDRLSAAHLAAHRVVECIDDPSRPLAERATRLLGFLLSGTLTEGEATDLARSRIRAHLKRPDFVEAFAAGYADPADCERGLRDLHALMTRAGISADA